MLLLSNKFCKFKRKYNAIAVFCLLLKILGSFLSYPMFTLATISIFWIASNYVILYQTFWKWNLANWYIHLHAEAILQQTISIFNSLLSVYKLLFLVLSCFILSTDNRLCIFLQITAAFIHHYIYSLICFYYVLLLTCAIITLKTRYLPVRSDCMFRWKMLCVSLHIVAIGTLTIGTLTDRLNNQPLKYLIK